MLWAVAGSPAEALAAPPPVEDFTRAPAIGEVAISPSGMRLALAVPAPNGRVQLAVMSLDPPGPAKAVTAVANADIFHIRWVNYERLVFRAYEPDAPADRSFAGVFAVNHDGSEFRRLIARVWRTGETGSSIRSRVLNWQWNLYRTIDDGSPDVIVSQRLFNGLADSPRDERRILLSRLNTRTGIVRSLSQGVPEGTKEWVLDDQGQPRFVTAYRDGKRSIHWWAEEGKAWVAGRRVSCLHPRGVSALARGSTGARLCTQYERPRYASATPLRPRDQAWFRQSRQSRRLLEAYGKFLGPFYRQ